MMKFVVPAGGISCVSWTIVKNKSPSSFRIASKADSPSRPNQLLKKSYARLLESPGDPCLRRVQIERKILAANRLPWAQDIEAKKENNLVVTEG